MRIHEVARLLEKSARGRAGRTCLPIIHDGLANVLGQRQATLSASLGADPVHGSFLPMQILQRQLSHLPPPASPTGPGLRTRPAAVCPPRWPYRPRAVTDPVRRRSDHRAVPPAPDRRCAEWPGLNLPDGVRSRREIAKTNARRSPSLASARADSAGFEPDNSPGENWRSRKLSPRRHAGACSGSVKTAVPRRSNSCK